MRQRSRPSRATRYIGVELQHVALRLAERTVLRDVCWRIEPGQRWVLMGANGAGKTQLLKLLAGDVWPAPGGQRHYRRGSETLDEPFGVKDHIAYVGAERQDRFEHYQWNFRAEAVIGTGLYRTEIPLDRLTQADRTRIEQLLRRLHIEHLGRRRFLTLSYGERRLVLLARALAGRPKLLLLDEFFNGLDARNHALALAWLQRSSRSTLPWVLSTHRVQDIPSAATHLCQLQGGRLLTRRITPGRKRLTALQRAPTTRLRATGSLAAPQSAQLLVQVSRASVWRDDIAVVRGLNLQVRRGQVWVVHGVNGSGKSTVLSVLYGTLGVARGGTVTRAGITPGVPLWQFQRRVGWVAPELQALHPRYLCVDEVVGSGLRASIGLDTPLSVAQHRAVRQILQRLGVASFARRTLATLSYGQMRRVLFARALASGPDMLLLDEPYTGLDTKTSAMLQAIVQREIERGTTIVMASHHRDEWPSNATHELELGRGRVRYCGPARD